jgi:hypothetical protein
LARHNPNDRPFVERFFLTLEEAGFHRLPNTTGSNPDDPRRTDPEMAAVRYTMKLEHLQDLVDVLIANFNADPHTSNGYRSPLEYLEYLCAHANDWPSTVDQTQVQKLTARRRSVHVRGNIQSGHRPHVNFEGVKYTNDLLRRSLGLIGKQIYVEWEGDIRTIRAFTEKGTELGSLRAAPPWNQTPHTLEMRRAVNSLRQRKVLHYLENCDPIEAYLTYLQSTSVKSRVVPSAYLKATKLLGEIQGSPVLAENGAPHKVTNNGIDNKVVAINANVPPIYRKGRKAING